jgi:hypothetical protein
VGLCRDDPSILLRMTLREIMYWYDFSYAWQKLKRELESKRPLPDPNIRRVNMRGS